MRERLSCCKQYTRILIDIIIKYEELRHHTYERRRERQERIRFIPAGKIVPLAIEYNASVQCIIKKNNSKKNLVDKEEVWKCQIHTEIL